MDGVQLKGATLDLTGLVRRQRSAAWSGIAAAQQPRKWSPQRRGRAATPQSAIASAGTNIKTNIN